MKWASVAIGCAGIVTLVVGVTWIYPPAGLIVVGLILIRAYHNLEKGAHAGKPE